VEPLSRPVVATSAVDRARAWIEWFGIGRLVAAAFATVVVCAGAVWLTSNPPPSTEASLPMATTTVLDSPNEPSGPTTTAAATVLVHVAGAVLEPGVYELRSGARVRDAILAAGGPAESADWDALNLAAVVADATRVYVPAVGEQLPAEMIAGSDPSSPVAGPVDVNRATVDELDELPGVGPATATAIVTERERNGPFVDLDDLERVPGIGPAKLEALRGLVTT